MNRGAHVDIVREREETKRNLDRLQYNCQAGLQVRGCIRTYSRASSGSALTVTHRETSW